jgi:1,4-alpha-glucan branching enzyme
VGYQLVGYFAPTSRFGNPQEFMVLVDRLHQAGIGVILDWVPSHSPDDARFRFLRWFQSFEHPDRKRISSRLEKLNYGRNEVRSLISNALFWLQYYHADGLRVDAVASMLYLDYSRNEGNGSLIFMVEGKTWIPSVF